MPIQSMFRILVISLFTAACVSSSIASAQDEMPDVICSGVVNPAGLALDIRGNIYTADKRTGYVFCIPQEAEPVLLGKVVGVPTSVAVDRVRNVFVGTESGMVYLVSLERSVKEVYRCKSCVMGLMVDRDGGLLIASDGGEIVKISRRAFSGQDE